MHKDILKENKVTREQLKKFREEGAELLFNADDSLVTIKDYLCVLVTDMQLLKHDLKDINNRLDKIEERMILR